MSFQDALPIILKEEGGFTIDDGGPTNYGITQSTYDSFRYKSVREITQEEVAAIYQNQYWLISKCNQIDPISSKASLVHFDCAVNCGVYWASRLLQRSLGIKEDGIIGPITLNTLTVDVKADEIGTIKAYLNTREAYYRSLVSWPKYGLSEWLPRLNNLRKLTGVANG